LAELPGRETGKPNVYQKTENIPFFKRICLFRRIVSRQANIWVEMYIVLKTSTDRSFKLVEAAR
jgi:hypothetical protein